MKRILILLIFLLSIFTALAHGDFEEAKKIIDSKTSCGQLTDGQLETLGDYYMEQMHPGEIHELMDERMGGEGSETLKEVHMNMARAFYCRDIGMMSPGMMDTMMGRGMMNNLAGYPYTSSMGAGNTMIGGYGMMGYSSGKTLLSFFYFIIGTVFFSVVFWLTYNLLSKKK